MPSEDARSVSSGHAVQRQVRRAPVGHDRRIWRRLARHRQALGSGYCRMQCKPAASSAWSASRAGYGRAMPIAARWPGREAATGSAADTGELSRRHGCGTRAGGSEAPRARQWPMWSAASRASGTAGASLSDSPAFCNCALAHPGVGWMLLWTWQYIVQSLGMPLEQWSSGLRQPT